MEDDPWADKPSGPTNPPSQGYSGQSRQAPDYSRKDSRRYDDDWGDQDENW